MAIRVKKDGRLFLNQNQCLEEMEEVPRDAQDGPEDGLRTILRGAVQRLLYLNLTRPDLSFKTNNLARVTPGTDLRKKIKEVKDGVAIQVAKFDYSPEQSNL